MAKSAGWWWCRAAAEKLHNGTKSIRPAFSPGGFFISEAIWSV
jgi:hypothetical protein